MSKQPHFEIVRSDAPQQWHARYRAGNGRIIWSTEQYARRTRALDAILMLTYNMGSWGPVPETREVDERATP